MFSVTFFCVVPNSKKRTIKLACVAGVQRGGRVEVECEREARRERKVRSLGGYCKTDKKIIKLKKNMINIKFGHKIKY